MGVKEFYEKMYRAGHAGQKKPALISRAASRLLAGFMVSRYDLAYQYLPGGESILDIGCGEDLTVIPLKKKYREIWGVDISQPRIDRMQQQFGNDPGIHLIVGDVNEKLNLKDASVDAVISLAVMEHVFDPYHLVNESYRLLKPGGILIVNVPNVAWLGSRLRLLAGRPPVTSCAEGWDGGHLHYFTAGSLKKLFRETGFQFVKIAYGGPSRRFWGSLLSVEIMIAGIKPGSNRHG